MPTLRPNYIPYTYMDPLGKPRGYEPQLGARELLETMLSAEVPRAVGRV